MTTPPILHISDLHFRAGDPYADQREIVLDGAIEAVRSLRASGPPPGVVCVTGDIAWSGRREDYDLAEVWLKKLLSVLELSAADMVLCPGNHDADRRFAKDLIRPGDVDTADAVFHELLPEADESACLEGAGDETPTRLRPFREYVRFCRRLGVPPLSQGDRSGHLWGVRSHKGFAFVVLNSAWFSKDNHEYGELHVGLPLVERLRTRCGLAPLQPGGRGELTIGLLHHPREWLAESCRSAFASRPADWSVLSRATHVILHGHTHDPRGQVSSAAGEALVVPAGSVDGGIRFPNRIHVLCAVDGGLLRRTSWSLDAGDGSYLWRADSDEVPASLPNSANMGPRLPGIVKADVLTRLREETVEFIRRKQDALPHRPDLSLPKTRLVTDLADEPTPSRGNVVAERPVDLPAVVQASRLVLLLGEIGAGKSTIGGQLALSALDDGRPAVVLALRGLTFPTGSTSGGVWERLRAAVVEHSPTLTALKGSDADELIDGSVLVLDGLDEIPGDEVDGLLRGCEAAVRARPSLSVVASVRPGRVEPVRYRQWRAVYTRTLDLQEVDTLVGDELGASRQVDAWAIVKRLSESPVLAALVTTPLLARLLARSLAQDGTRELRTSGDLLRQMCLERLGGWDHRESRPRAAPLDGTWPDAMTKLRSLARAVFLVRGSEVDRAGFIDRLVVDAAAASTPRAAAAALLEFAVGASLITCEPHVEVESHRLAEYLCGEGIAELLVREEPVPVAPDAWREWSYASASLRHRGELPERRSVLIAAVRAFVEAGNPVGAAYVAWESQDRPIAESLLGLLRELGPRPMSLWWEERSDSARAAAGAVLLAGAVGFDWFVDAYLNPYLPDPRTGSAVDDTIIAWWSRLCDPETLTPECVRRLWAWASPRLAYSGPYRDMRLAAVCSLIPAEFPVEARISLLRDLLESGTLGARAEMLLTQEFAGPYGGLVQRALAARVGSSEAPAFASARLWLALIAEGIEPSVVDGVLGAGERGDRNPRWLEATRECRRRMGQSTWLRYLRWSVYGASDSSRGAAVALFLEGERSMAFLGWPLLHAMHDGARTPGAEAAFGAVLDTSGAPGWAWFETRMVEAADGGRFDGPHTGWWRVFLRRISAMGPDGVQPFSAALRGLSQFVLPRHADVRDAVAGLLNGPDGTAYRDRATGCLKAFDPALRVAAAATLAISTPEPDVEVLAVLLLAIGGGFDSPLENHWEWVDMLAGLRWSAAALSRLRPVLDDLPKGARVLGLFLMDLHGVALSMGEHQELSLALLAGVVRGERTAQGHPWFAGEGGRARLVEVSNGQGAGQQEAANALLRLHAPTLTSVQRARAAVTGLSWSAWSANLLRREVLAALADEAYAAAIIQQEAPRVDSGAAPSPLARLLTAIRAGTGWPEIIARMYGLTDRSLGGDDGGGTTIWLIDLAACSGSGPRIGEAARELLASSVPATSWDRRARPWIAILADELAPTGDAAHLEEELRRGGDGGLSDPRPTLLARIRRHGRMIPGPVASTAPVPVAPAPTSFGEGLSPAVSNLRSLANDASSKCVGARHLLRVAALTFKDGDDDPVTEVGDGRSHALLRGATQFILFGRVAPEVVARAFPIELFNIEQDHDLMFLADVWRHVLRRGLSVTAGGRAQVEAGLRERLRSDALHAPAIAYLLMDLGASLRDDDLEPVLARVASWYFRDEYGLLPRLADGLTRHPERDAARRMLERALALADGAKESQDNPSDMALGPLFLAALYWALGGNERERAARVTTRALGKLWTAQRSWHRPDENLDPAFRLLALVPAELLRDVLRRGVREGNPATEAMCSFILAAFAAPAGSSAGDAS